MKNEANNNRGNVYQMVTDRIIAQMEQGIVPWHKPWTGAADGAINYVSRRAYSVLNQWLLGRDGEWLTFKQVQQCGGRIKKGAKAGMVVFYTQHQYKVMVNVEDEDGNVHEEESTKVKPVLRAYNVFHISDCEGIESKIQGGVKNDVEPIEQAEKVISEYVSREKELTFRNDSVTDKAYYSPASDMVCVPMISQYDVVEEYYSTTFHELVHSTMKETRCNRKAENKMAAFGSADYSREELVAETGSAMLCTKVGIDCDKAFKNSVAYIQSWLKALKNDNKMIVWAASRAEKAAKYIMGEQ
jgi:antirestriction protein ArdC